MDLGSPFVAAGVACVVAAIVGGGVKMLGHEVPVISSVGRQLMLAIVGIALIVVPPLAAQSAEFRVTSASVQWDQSVVLMCASQPSYTGSITVSGAGGTVQYRLVLNGSPRPVELLAAAGPGEYPVTGSVPVTYSPGLPPWGQCRLNCRSSHPTHYRRHRPNCRCSVGRGHPPPPRHLDNVLNYGPDAR